MKNWLIRTKNNHILGPVTKEKVISLIEKGSLRPDDEICSGNGYWIFVREQDLIDKYITGDEVQSFNPVYEAKDVLPDGLNIAEAAQTTFIDIKKMNLKGAPEEEEKEVKKNDKRSGSSMFPEDHDLEYPDVNGKDS